MKRSRWIVWTVAGAVTATAVVAAVFASRGRPAAKKDDIPVAEVRRGDIEIRVHADGELRASHSIMLTAPAIGGDSLQITQLARTGELVKKGDTIVEFDPSEQSYKLEQSRSELLQAEQEITKANADAVVLAAEDKVALLKARYSVRRAELDVEKSELVSKIDGEKNKLALQQANRVLAEQEKDAESHKASGQASIYLATEKYNKAKLAMDQAQQNLDKMRVTAPMDGLVSIQKNMNASGGFFFTGMSLPDFHPGDQAQPGSAIAQVVDPAGLDLTSKVSEQEHSNVKVGQAVEIDFDALPGHRFNGTVKSVGGMSMRQFFEANSGGGFDVAIQLADTDARLRSGFTAQIVFVGDTRKDVLYLPRQALFMKDGKRVVYIAKGTGYEQREVSVQSQNESRAEIAGLAQGTQVALVDPTAPRKSASGSSAGGSSEGKP
jgi:multidrug efflux pump subunit AcrA (membrane-fusion protein)